MNFDIFDEVNIGEKDLLLRNCKSAERNIMISPYNAIANSRAALEILCKGLIKKNNIDQIKPQPKICKNCNMPIEETTNLPPNLATMIDTCLRERLFTNEEAAALIRKYGNDTLHANKGAQKLHVVNDKNIEKASSCVRALYTIFVEVFGAELSVPEFNLNKVPFGFYEIVRAVPKAPNEVICGENNYFVKDPQENYYYFQVFHRNTSEDSQNELGARGVLTGNRIKEDKGRKSYLLDVHYPSNVLAESDREYIAYSVYSDSKLLSEIAKPQFTEKEIVQIAIDLTNVLVELGNENKVQDNCKAYLPQNKIASMQEYYNQNHSRVREDIEHNKSEIKLYRERLDFYEKLYEAYQESKKAYDEYVATIKTNLNNIVSAYEKLKTLEQGLDTVLNARARKEIFLQVYETKNCVVRFLRKRYQLNF